MVDDFLIDFMTLNLSLQKQIDCFNHRVVTMVAVNLKRQWLCIVYFADCIRQPERKFPRVSYNRIS